MVFDATVHYLLLEYLQHYRDTLLNRQYVKYPAKADVDGSKYPPGANALTMAGQRRLDHTVAVLATLENIGKLPVGSPAAKTLRAWLRQDLEASWSKLAAQRTEPQQSLELGPTPDELPLASPGP
jgi:hypothetical protein